MQRKTKGFVMAVIFAVIGIICATGGVAIAETLRVPEDYATIQLAVDAALPEDQIRVGPGEWCGATITETVDLFGEGNATIIGCASNPALGPFRIGFFLPDASASGSSFRHFLFDGAGVSNQPPTGNFDPLAFAIFARGASDVIISQNHVIGTVQSFTNTDGSDWTVNHNIIEDLTVFTCDGLITCGGGDGIVFQDRNAGGPRQTDNTAMFNFISGAVPDNLELFSMAGIIILGAEDGTVLQKNQITIPGNPLADGEGHAIRVSDVCCGGPATFQTVINSVIVKNDARNSEAAVVIDKDSTGGTGNSEGLRLRGNFGVNEINEVSSTVTNRSIKTLIELP
jgi:hypothetical protein